MAVLIRSLFLALASFFTPRILWLTLKPILLIGAIWAVVIFFIWEAALIFIVQLMTESTLGSWLNTAVSQTSLQEWRAVMAPLLLMVCLIPLIGISLLIYISLTTVPQVIVYMSRRQRFQSLTSHQEGGLVKSLWETVKVTLIALIVLLLSFPLWWFPPLVAVIPPLIWGWLTMRLMSFDVLAQHANDAERLLLISSKRKSLWLMGILCGLMGALPTFFWASSVLTFVFFPIVSIFVLWIYSCVFIFSSLWFAYYLLEELQNLRQSQGIQIHA
jgi:hypothetical protein